MVERGRSRAAPDRAAPGHGGPPAKAVVAVAAAAIAVGLVLAWVLRNPGGETASERASRSQAAETGDGPGTGDAKKTRTFTPSLPAPRPDPPSAPPASPSGRGAPGPATPAATASGSGEPAAGALEITTVPGAAGGAAAAGPERGMGDATLRVGVVTLDGQPLAAEGTVSLELAGGGVQGATIRRGPTTRGDGFLTFEGLEAGQARVRVIAPEHGEQAGSARIPARGEVRIDLVLEPAGLIRGRVVMRDGTPRPGARITAEPLNTGPAGPRARIAAEAAPDGGFALAAVHGGRYRVSAWDPALAADDPVDLTAPADNVELTLFEGASVEVDVDVEGGYPERSVASKAMLVSESGQGGTTYTDWYGRDGPKIRFDGVRPDSYRLTAQIRGFPPAEVRLTVGTGGTAAERLTIRRGGVVEGVVRDAANRPVRDATVTVGSLRGGPLGSLNNAVTNESGSFRLDGIPVGDGIDLVVEVPGRPPSAHRSPPIPGAGMIVSFDIVLE